MSLCSDSGRIPHRTETTRMANMRHRRCNAASTKSRLKAALQFNVFDQSGGHQCWLRLPPISNEADASETEDHHRPCGRFGDRSSKVDYNGIARCKGLIL